MPRQATAPLETEDEMRALLVTPAFTVLDDGSVRTTPDNTWNAGLGGFLDRLAVRAGDELVVALDGAAAHALKLPAEPSEHLTEGIESARAAGWTAPDEPSGWMTFHATGRPTIIVCIMPMLARGRTPLFDPPNGLVLVPALAMFHELTGRAYRGTPGVAGMVLLRELAPKVSVGRGRAGRITWKPDSSGPHGAVETAWTDWHAQGALEAFRHGYDARRMYLNAAGQCEHLCPWTLKNTRLSTFDRHQAGWWKCELSPWNDPRMPNPAGPVTGLVAWLTTPTVALLDELATAGTYGGVRIIDSWTGPGKRLMRPWAERLEDAYQKARQLVDEREADAPTPRAMDASRVKSTVKAVYRESIGLLNLDTNAIHRPDWHYAIIAQARSNLWRRLHSIGQTTGRWPASWVNTDTVWYEHGSENPDTATPRGLVIGDSLGQFGIKATEANQ